MIKVFRKEHLIFKGSDDMTKKEISEQYSIPGEVLEEYEKWGLCGTVKKVIGAWQYDNTDITRLSLVMTLHDIGFTKEEVETYMRLLLEENHTDEVRLVMLTAKRQELLKEIHLMETQLEQLDYLRHEICKCHLNA